MKSSLRAIGMDEARRADAPKVFSGFRKTLGNVSEGPMLPTRWSKNLRGPSGGLSDKPGKARKMLEAAKATADPLLIEGIWRTQAQSHTSFEPHAAVAQFNGEHLTVYLSTQAVHEHAKLIAEKYRLPAENVRVIADHVGGGFGSKGALRAEAFAAIELARAANAPVRVVLDRHEELSVTGYRPGAELTVSLLPSRDGVLKALSLKAYADTGAGVNSTIAALARLIYPAEAKELIDYDVVSNLPPGAPFRGPGGPVVCFALEQAVDEAALRTLSRSHRSTSTMGSQHSAPAPLRLGKQSRRVAHAARERGRTRPLPARRRCSGWLLALLLAAGLPGRTRSEGRQTGRQYFDAGHRQRRPYRARQYRRWRLCPRTS